MKNDSARLPSPCSGIGGQAKRKTKFKMFRV